MIKVSTQNGITTWILNVANRPMNVISSDFIASLVAETLKIIKDPNVRGLVITSERKEFLAGADLDFVLSAKTIEQSLKITGDLHLAFRQLETWGKPVVAAINGTVLGGGLELALCCHHRIAIDDSKTQIGFPEVKLGLLPGAGGTQRLSRMLGFQAAMPFLLEAKMCDPKKAKEAGIIHDLAKDAADLMAKALNWIEQNPKVQAPWDDAKFKIPGGDVQGPKGYQVFPGAVAMIAEKTWGNYPAAQKILSCVYEGLQLPFDKAIILEQQHFAELMTSKISKNIIRTTFFGINDCNKGIMRPKDIPVREVKKVGILGAGMMGSGIAYATAMAGIPCVLKDVSMEAAEKGKNYSVKLLDQAIQKGRMTEEKKKQVLELIQVTDRPQGIAGCDLIIEAVIEDRALKARVTRETEEVMDPNGIFASNTSTLPITGLAEASQRPQSFIGLHFFSPVDKMPLIEVIMGQKTSPEALAFCFDYIKKIKKTPIVVNDGRGFYTSRVFTTYVSEGIACLTEGIHPALIENAGKAAGMPVGPLAVADEVSIDLMYHILKQTVVDIGEAAVDQQIYKTTDLFVNKLGRLGKKCGKGFYDYPEGGKKHLSEELNKQFKLLPQQPTIEEVSRRLLTIQALETCRIYEEKVLMSARDADVGSLLGWGFPAYTGGTLGYIELRGVQKFVEDCQYFESKYGKRFAPSKGILNMLDKKIISHYDL